MSAPLVDAFADALLDAHLRGIACVPPEALAPRNVAEAYRIQKRVLDRLGFGARPVAWKVSPTPPGEERLASPVPGVPLHSPATIEAGARTILCIEAEIAFRLAATPPIPSTVAAVRAAVDEMVVLIELCETRFADFAGASALAKLADFQSHGAFVVGSGTRAFDRDFATQRVDLTIEGRAGVSAIGSHPTGSLWEMVAWAVEHCASRGMPLQSGDLVTTGSWTGTTPLARGEAVTVRFEGIGEARLALD